MSYLSDNDIDEAARLWNAGNGTLQISERLRVTEATVYNFLNHIREEARAIRHVSGLKRISRLRVAKRRIEERSDVASPHGTEVA